MIEIFFILILRHTITPENLIGHEFVFSSYFHLDVSMIHTISGTVVTNCK